MTRTTPDKISSLLLSLSTFVGFDPTNRFFAVTTHPNGTITAAVHTEIQPLLSDAHTAVDLLEAMREHLNRPIVFMAVTDAAPLGQLLLEKMRHLSWEFDIVESVLIRGFSYSRFGGNGPRLPLVQSAPLEEQQQGTTHTHNQVSVTRN